MFGHDETTDQTTAADPQADATLSASTPSLTPSASNSGTAVDASDVDAALRALNAHPAIDTAPPVAEAAPAPQPSAPEVPPIVPAPAADAPQEEAAEEEAPVEEPEATEPEAPVAEPEPAVSETDVLDETAASLDDAPAAGEEESSDLLDLKQSALQQLTPLIDHLEQTPEEKFRTTMMMIQASDNQALLQSAYEAAQEIEDEKVKAQALLDIVNEINYFTQQTSENQQ